MDEFYQRTSQKADNRQSKGQGGAAPGASKEASAQQAPPAQPEVQATAVAGENEDGVDEALVLELSKQELLFQKCLRKRADREQQRKNDKQAQKAAQKALKEKALEAAFDNEVDAVLSFFDQGVEPECSDEHSNTLLSEASAGGAIDVCEVLLGEGCDPNSFGRYRRTPLWRAAYAGHSELLRTLLRSGGDPRECDAEGQRPIDVASNPPSKELLLCWDTSGTDRIKEKAADGRMKQAKEAETAEKEVQKRQVDELDQALQEAERKAQIAKTELARARKLLVDYRQQKVSFAEQGFQDRLQQLEPLLEAAEGQVKIFEAAVRDWEWKVSRAKLKRSDLKQQEREKAAKKAGKAQGFRLQLEVAAKEDFDQLLTKLSDELEVKADIDIGENKVELKKGDSLIPEGPFGHLHKSEFSKKTLSRYGQQPEQEEAAQPGAQDEPPLFPITLAFSRGFNRTIDIRGIADVLLKDVGEFRQADGRWPLVIDPSGRTSTFVRYTGAVVFEQAELKEMDPQRLRRALLKGLLHGGCVLVDLGPFDFDTDAIEEPWNALERGLFTKLVDRSALYSYLLPRRFRSLVTQDVAADFQAGAFVDENISKFVFGFVTKSRDPRWSFAKQFYSISVKGADDEEEPGR